MGRLVLGLQKNLWVDSWERRRLAGIVTKGDAVSSGNIIDITRTLRNSSIRKYGIR
jgi:hypothetical protein